MKSDVIRPYFINILTALIQGNNQKELIQIHRLENKVGFTLPTNTVLKREDKIFLKEYIIHQLQNISYRINHTEGNKIHLHAKLKLRVDGNHLYGNIHMIDLPKSLTLLIYPYAGKSFTNTIDHMELYHFLFGA